MPKIYYNTKIMFPAANDNGDRGRSYLLDVTLGMLERFFNGK